MDISPSSDTNRAVIHFEARNEAMMFAYEGFSGLSIAGLKLRLQFVASCVRPEWQMTTQLPFDVLPRAGERCLERSRQREQTTDLRRMALVLLSTYPPTAI